MLVAYRASILFERVEVPDDIDYYDDTDYENLEWKEIVRYGLGASPTDNKERMSTNLKQLLRSVRVTASTIELEDLIEKNIELRDTDLAEEEN